MACAVCHRVKQRCKCANGYLAEPRKSLQNVPLTCPYGCKEPVMRKNLESHAVTAHGVTGTGGRLSLST